MAMFATLALGAPLGGTPYAVGGFAAIVVSTALVPLVTILVVAPLAPIPPQRGVRSSLLTFAASLVAARLLLGHIPDRLGGARVALISVLIEVAGLALIWLAPSQVLAAAGALLTGLRFALVYPGLSIEAVRRAPP
jgi:nitrate/nitrite transporter NarK